MEKITLTNMCMIYNSETQQVLVQNRIKRWKGLAFPGGHVEKGEAIIPSVIREIKEETNLTISNLEMVGIRNWYDKDTNERTIVFLYKTSTFDGQLIDQTDEGEVFWVSVTDLEKLEFAPGFKDQIKIFFENNISEIFSFQDGENTWKYLFY